MHFFSHKPIHLSSKLSTLKACLGLDAAMIYECPCISGETTHGHANIHIHLGDLFYAAGHLQQHRSAGAKASWAIQQQRLHQQWRGDPLFHHEHDALLCFDADHRRSQLNCR